MASTPIQTAQPTADHQEHPNQTPSQKNSRLLPVVLILLGMVSFTVSGIIIFRSLTQPTGTRIEPQITPEPTGADPVSTCLEKIRCTTPDGTAMCVNPALAFCECMGGTALTKSSIPGGNSLMCSINGTATDMETYYQSHLSGPQTMPEITQDELDQGWYWGSQEQKKSGTPVDWLFSGNGTRSDYWHKPGVTSIDVSVFTCPSTPYVDCMPGPTEGIKLECTSEYLTWANVYCPNFRGAAY